VHDGDRLARRFDAERGRLRAVAYRMLGSLADADDAVQETWLRLAGAESRDVQNLPGWLTTVLARICLDMLRSRRARREEPLEVHVPDPIVSLDASDPETEALLGDAIGVALLVVLDTLSPPERLAFVLHDVFAVPFDQIGPILNRSPAAAKQLASRARRQVQNAPAPDTDLTRQRQLVDAFLTAARGGDLDALLAILDPDVLLRADAGAGQLGPSRLARGREEVATQVLRYAHLAPFARPALVNGTPGAVAAPGGNIVAVLAVTTQRDRIVEINILADPRRLRHLQPSGGVERRQLEPPDSYRA
jgi:RNA polymerase sigma factor (sigma-70 family)